MGQQTFFEKSYTVNILDLAGHMVSVETMLKFEFQTIFTSQNIIFLFITFINVKTILNSVSTFKYSFCQHLLYCLFENKSLKI